MTNETFVQQLTTILQNMNLVPADEAVALKESFERSSKANFDDFLLEEGLVEKDDLLRALAQLYQVPSFDVVGYFFKHQLVRMFPKEVLVTNAFIPLERDENMLIVVASNPADQELLPLIGEYVSYDIRFHVGIRPDIVGAAEEFYDRSLAETSEFGDEIEEDIDEENKMREGEMKEAEEVAEFSYEDFEKDE